MKLRSFFNILAVGVLVLLLIGGSGFYWLMAQNPLNLLRAGWESRPAAAMFVPKQAIAMVSLLVKPDRLAALQQVTVQPRDRQEARVELEQFQQSLLANTDLDYPRDIRPWLGEELTFAVTSWDIDRDDLNGQQPGYLLVATTQDAVRSREFLQLFWQKRAISGVELKFEQYKGVRLIYGGENPTASLASAAVGDRFVLFANHPKVIRDALNNVQAAELGLEASPAYQQALDSLAPNRIGLLFVNLPQVAAKTSQLQSPVSRDSAPALYESLVMGLELNRQGLLADTALLAASGQTLPPIAASLSKPVTALRYIPSTTAFSVAGTNLKQVWTQITTGLSSYKPLSGVLTSPLTALQTRWNIDLSADIFSWVQGEYALSLLPQANSDSTDWIFVAQRSEEAESALKRLDAIAQKQGLSIGSLTLGNQQVSVWTRLAPIAHDPASPASTTLQAQIQGVHTTVGNYEILTTSLDAMDQALQASQTSLLDSPKFEQAISPFSQPNNGYLYLDWAASRTLLERQLPILKLLELAGASLFNHLQTLSISSDSSQENLRHAQMFLTFGDIDLK